MFNIDFYGVCQGCNFGDGPGTLATIGSQLHLLVFVGLWIYSFVHREVFVWTVNVMASLLLGLCHIFHKIEVLGAQPPCLPCIAAIYSRFYDLEGSAIPSSPVAIVCYYMLVIFVYPLELGSAYRHFEGSPSIVRSDNVLWNSLSHLDVLIVPIWAAGARLYAGLATTRGVVAGAVIGAAAVLLLFSVIRSKWYRSLVGYVMDREPLDICGLKIPPIPGIASTLHFLSFETRLLNIIWHNLDNLDARR